MKDFIEFLVKGICEKPEEVIVKETKEDDSFVYDIKVSDEDMGIVIGRSGKTIRSLRNLAKAKAIKDNIRIQLMLEESDEYDSSKDEEEESEK
jgi:predicted RNA-binding protein YlqC (UPF0109 family)